MQKKPHTKGSILTPSISSQMILRYPISFMIPSGELAEMNILKCGAGENFFFFCYQ